MAPGDLLLLMSQGLLQIRLGDMFSAHKRLPQPWHKHFRR